MTVLHIASKFGNYDICEYILNSEILRFKSCVCDLLSEGNNHSHEAGCPKCQNLQKPVNERSLCCHFLPPDSQNLLYFHLRKPSKYVLNPTLRLFPH